MPLYLPSFDEIMAVAETRGEDSDAPHLWRGLVGAWPLQETGGDKAFDVSGYRNSGTLALMDVAADHAVSEKGRAINFDGSDAYISIPAKAALTTITSSMSLSVWVRPDSVTGDRMIFGAYGSGSGFPGWALQISGGALKFYASVSGWKTIGTGWVANSWQHVAVVHTGSAVLSYRNGKYLTQAACGLPGVTAHSIVAIGQDSLNYGYFDGQMTLPAMWNGRALTPAEIQQLYADTWAMYRLRAVVHPVAVAAGGDITETASPVSATWSVVAPSTAKSITPGVVSATFTAVTPSTAKTIALAVVSATWSPVAPATVKTIAVDPVTATWTVPTPTAGGSLITVAPDPVAATWSPITPATLKTVAVSPVSASWSVPTPIAGSSFIAVDVFPVSATWSPVAPVTAKTTTPDPVTATWTPAAPTTAKTLSVDPVALTWSIVAAELTKATAPDPVAAAWLLPDVTTAGGAGTFVAVDPVVATWTVAVARGGVKPVLDSANVLRVQSESRVLRVQS